MKILYVAPRLNNAGPINQLYSLVSALNHEICSFKIVTLYSEIENSRWDDFKNIGADIECLGLRGKLSVFNIGSIIKNKIKQERPDVIHSEGLPADLAVFFSHLDGFFWCSTIHCNIYNDYKSRFHSLAWIQIFLHRCCMSKMTKIICCSNSIKKYYEKEYGDRVISIQNGVLTEKPTLRDNYCTLELRKKLHISIQKKVIVVVGSLDERKNSIFIIDNIKDWIEENNAQLVFLGTGPLEEECKKKAKGYDIVFKGQVGNVQDYLQCADVYLSASKSEGLPLSVLEAGTYGIELCLSDIEQHREISMYGGCNGINYFDLNDGKSLSYILDNINKHDKAFQKEIAEYFYKYFSANVMAEKYYNMYKRIGVERGMA